MKEQFTPENITSLARNEVFVFGSNLAGKHAGGAARVACKRFGAVWGQGVGLQGQSYAIPTMQGGVDTIRPYVDEFIAFAKSHPELTFYVTRIGCGIAGFKDEEIAPLFDAAFDLPNVILPEMFAYIINHGRQLASETANLVFHSIPIEFFPEDLARAESMTHEQKMEFFYKLKKEKKYKIKHDSPQAAYFPPVLGTTSEGWHKIAIGARECAFIAGQKLYSSGYQWGFEFDSEILSVVALEGCDDPHSKGQFIVLVADGTIRRLWSESNIINLSPESDFVSVASGCGGLVFGLRRNGTVAVLGTDGVPKVFGDVAAWSDICQIDAGPRHVVGLRRDGSVVAAGKPSACAPLSRWKGISKIYVSKVYPGFGKTNDLTFAIDNKGWLHVDGDIFTPDGEFWKCIRAQYDVTDVIENGYAVWVRMSDGHLRCVTYYGKMNYLGEIGFVDKCQPGLRYMDAYGPWVALVDTDGEFRIFNTESNKEIPWTSWLSKG